MGNDSDCTMNNVKYRTRSHLLEEQLKEKALLALQKHQECQAEWDQSWREDYLQGHVVLSAAQAEERAAKRQ
jgi:hypothetical protein